MMSLRKAFITLISTFICASVIQTTFAAGNSKVYQISKSRANEVVERFGDLFWNQVETNKLKMDEISSGCHQKLKFISRTHSEHWTEECKLKKAFLNESESNLEYTSCRSG